MRKSFNKELLETPVVASAVHRWINDGADINILLENLFYFQSIVVSDEELKEFMEGEYYEKYK